MSQDSATQPEAVKEGNSQTDAPKNQDRTFGAPGFSLFQTIYSKEECEARREQARGSSCIDAKGLRALQVLEAVPVCSEKNEFSYWEPCENNASQEIRRILEGVRDCPKDEGSGPCELVTVEMKRRRPSPSSYGQRIMVIDGFKEFSAWRYKSRILDVLEPSTDGRLESITLKSNIPKAMKEVAEILDRKYPWVSPKSLFAAGNDYHSAFSESWHLMFDHGAAIVNHLAEFNPKAEFLMVELSDVDMMDACAPHSDQFALARMRKFIRNEAQSTIAKINEYQINYVNMSFGRTAENVISRRKQECSTTPEMRDEIAKIYFEEYFVPISSLENVIVVQAAANSNTELLSLNIPLQKVGNDYLFKYDDLVGKNINNLSDCVELPSRLRVGKTSFVKPCFFADGTDDKKAIDDETFRNAFACTDMYINEGAEIRLASLLRMPRKEDWSFALWMSIDGLSTEPSQMSGSSFAAPVAISYLIQLKSQNPTWTTKQLLDEVKKGGKVKDLLRHQLHLFKIFGSDDFQEVIANHRSQETSQ